MSHVTLNIEPIEYGATNFPTKNKSKRDDPEENSSLVVYCLLVSITILATLFAVALSMIALDNPTTCKPTIPCDCDITDTGNRITLTSHPNLPPESSTTDPTPTVTTTTKQPKYVVDFWVETSSLNNVKSNTKVVTFDYVYHNDGSIDINSGIFTAPETQTYSFLVDAASSIELQVNGLTIDYDASVQGSDKVFSEKRIKLDKGDRVNLFDNSYSPSLKTHTDELKPNRVMNRKTTFFGKSVGDI